MTNALLPKPRLPHLVSAALFAALVPATALAVEVESAVYDADDNELIIAGVDLSLVDDVTLTDFAGRETSLSFTYTRERSQRIVAQLVGNAPGTYRLRVYSNTVLQDEMDVSVHSSAGAVSRGAITQRTLSATCLVTKCTIDVRCPNGFRAISGGFRKLTFNSALIKIDDSYPYGADRWRVVFRKENSSTYSIALEAYAVCLKQD